MPAVHSTTKTVQKCRYENAKSIFEHYSRRYEQVKKGCFAHFLLRECGKKSSIYLYMNTKKTLCLCLCMMTLAACKNEVTTTTGDYTYKTSGVVEISATLADGTSHLQRVTLPDETGQLQVINLHSSDSLLLLFNQLGGSAWQNTATVKDQQLTFPAYEHTLALTVEDVRFDTLPMTGTVVRDSVHQREVFDCTVSGTGHTYDDAIVLTLQYTGTSRTSEKTLKGTDIQTIAKRN